MCEERERLIGYVYDECNGTERQAIEEHLETCPTCRREIAGLRGVRQDLLAWSVPEHETVWRPVAPPRVESPWRALPAWAMAAAAGVMLMVGAAGGAATYALLPHAPNQSARTAAPAESTAARAETVSALERRLAELERATAIAAQSASVSAPQSPMNVDSIRTRTDDLDRRLRSLASQQEELRVAVINSYGYAAEVQAKQSAFERRTSNFINASLPLGDVPQGFGGR